MVGPEDSPFVEYEWIHALESTGLASTATRWQSVHLCAFSGAPGAADRTLVAEALLYAEVHRTPSIMLSTYTSYQSTARRYIYLTASVTTSAPD